MVKFLIDSKPDIVDIENDNGKTPLFFAAEINSKHFREKISSTEREINLLWKYFFVFLRLIVN